MLKGISHYISPELLSTLSCMGHGDEIVFADAHFPGETYNKNVIRADGVNIPQLLDAVLPLLVLDQYDDEHLIMMSAVEGDILDPSVEKSYTVPIELHSEEAEPITRIGRQAFYERSEKAFAVVMTGETAKYGNIILKKGVTPLI